MFRNALQNLHKPLQRSVVHASFTKYATYWTILAVLSFAGLIIGLDIDHEWCAALAPRSAGR